MKFLNSKIKINSVLVLLFTILVIAVVAQFTLFRNNKLILTGDNSQKQERSPVVNNTKTAPNTNRIIIDFGDGRKIDDSLKADTPFKALDMIATRQGYKITTKQYKYGLMVEEINRLKNTRGKYWTYLVNRVPGKIAADRYILAPGDVVEWKYTSVK